MSYFTVVPNYGPNVLRVNNPGHLQPQFSIQGLLNIISTALRTSILNYQNNFLKPNPPEKIQKPHPVQAIEQTITKLRIEDDLKEQDKQSYLLKTIQKNNIQQKTTSPAINNINVSPFIGPKNPENPKAIKQQEAIDAKKIQNLKQQKQSPKQVPKEVEEVAGVPRVDLIDCAYLSGLCQTREELILRRYQLQKRRVKQWIQNEKGKFRRRQLRMLNN